MARMKNRHLFAKESFTMDGVAKTAGTFTLPRVLSPHMIQSPVVHCTSSTATSSTTAAAATTTTVTLQHNNCKCTTTTTTTTANSNNINNSNNKISINNSCIRGYTSGSFCYISRFINVIVLLLIILPALLLPVFGGNVNAEKRLSSRIVTTKYGALRGHLVTLPNRSLQPVESFLGIPYASPPVGKLRFMPPVTPAHWSGVRSAITPGPVCPQKYPDVSNETASLKNMTPGRISRLKRMLPALKNQSEDCLYLNIFTPANAHKELGSASSSSTRLPVLMFIHGESFQWNSGSTIDGTVLASYSNLVVVTINYRLGLLGFFPALDGNSRGNFGLMDQVAALHWIAENIENFGGNPSSVTIMGEGHGAACVNLLMLSPMARGLFHRAIMAGGSALSPWAMATDAVGYSRKLAAKVGCPDDPDKNAIMVNCLRQKSASELVNIDLESPRFLAAIGPTVDGIVIPNDPSTLMDSFNSIFGSYDLLLGLSKVGYYEFTAQDEKAGIEPFRRDKIIRTLVRNLYDYHLQEIHLTISNEYTDWTRPHSNSNPMDVLESLTELLSDATLVAPVIKSGLMHGKLNKVTYLFEFAYGSEHGDHPPHLGCVHGDELSYIFGAPLVPGMSLGYFTSVYSRQESSLAELVMTYLGNFVRTGNPNSDTISGSGGASSSSQQSSSSNASGGGASSSSSTSTSSQLSASGESTSSKSTTGPMERIERVSWPAFDDKQQLYLSLSLKPKVKDHYHAHRVSYWNNLIPKLHVPGSVPSGLEHHLLADHDDINSYEGKIRDSSVSRIKALMDSTSGESTDTTAITGGGGGSGGGGGGNITSGNSTSSTPSTLAPSKLAPPSIAVTGGTTLPKSESNLDKGKSSHELNNVKSALDHGTSQRNNHHFHPETDPSSKSINASSVSMMFQEGSYSTALSVTIGVGTSLLIVNVLIFVGTFYQRDRVNTTNGSSSSCSNGTNNSCQSGSSLLRSGHNSKATEAGEQIHSCGGGKLAVTTSSDHHHHHHHHGTLSRMAHSLGGHTIAPGGGQLHHHHHHDNTGSSGGGGHHSHESGSIMSSFKGATNRNIYPGDPSLSVPTGESLSPMNSPSHSGHHHHHHQQQQQQQQQAPDYPSSYSTHVSMVNSGSFYSTASTLLPGTTGSTVAVTTLPPMTEDPLLTDGNNSKPLDPKLLGNPELLSASFDFDHHDQHSQHSHHLHQPLLLQHHQRSDHHMMNI